VVSLQSFIRGQPQQSVTHLRRKRVTGLVTQTRSSDSFFTVRHLVTATQPQSFADAVDAKKNPATIAKGKTTRNILFSQKRL